MKPELRPSSSFSLHELAELFTRAYEGYFVPFALDAERLSFMVRAYDLDLDTSRVALDGGEPIGLANLGIRGREAWVGGVGVVAGARRGGVGRLLMEALHEEARERRIERVWLEVIDRNAAALALYRDLGYEHVRDVEVWFLDAEVPPDAAEPVAVGEARALIAARREAREPWQRADETLDRLDDLEALRADDAAVVFRASGGHVSILQLEGTQAGAERLVAALRARGPVSVMNAPPGHTAASALAAHAARVTLRQHELVLKP